VHVAVLMEVLPEDPDAGYQWEYGGVGIAWGNELQVDRVVPGGPAARAGVELGDVFWKIDDDEVDSV
jgi:S1-C subfamily serine protease